MGFQDLSHVWFTRLVYYFLIAMFTYVTQRIYNTSNFIALRQVHILMNKRTLENERLSSETSANKPAETAQSYRFLL